MKLCFAGGQGRHADRGIANVDHGGIEPVFLEYTGVAGDEQHATALVKTAEGKDGFGRR